MGPITYRQDWKVQLKEYNGYKRESWIWTGLKLEQVPICMQVSQLLSKFWILAMVFQGRAEQHCVIIGIGMRRKPFLSNIAENRASTWILILPENGSVSCCFMADPAFPILECFPSLALVMTPIRHLWSLCWWLIDHTCKAGKQPYKPLISVLK